MGLRRRSDRHGENPTYGQSDFAAEHAAVWQAVPLWIICSPAKNHWRLSARNVHPFARGKTAPIRTPRSVDSRGAAMATSERGYKILVEGQEAAGSQPANLPRAAARITAHHQQTHRYSTAGSCRPGCAKSSKTFSILSSRTHLSCWRQEPPRHATGSSIPSTGIRHLLQGYRTLLERRSGQLRYRERGSRGPPVQEKGARGQRSSRTWRSIARRSCCDADPDGSAARKARGGAFGGRLP